MRVRTAPEDVTFDSLYREVQSLPINAEIKVALAIRAMKANNFEKASELSEEATRESPEWPPAWFTLGQSQFGAETKHLRDGLVPARPPDVAKLEAAESNLSKAVQLCRQRTPTHPILLDALLARAKTKDLLVYGGGAEDIQEAYALDPADPEVLRQYSVLLRSRGDSTQAIACARRAVAKGHAALDRLGLADLLRDSGDSSAKAEATSLYRDLAFEPGLPFHAEAANSAFEGYCQSGDRAAAESFVRGLREAGDNLMSAILDATLSHRQGHVERARKFAAQALREINERASVYVVRQLALLLGNLGEYAEALRLWQSIFVPASNSVVGHNIVAIAEHLRRFDVAMATCKVLREQGVISPELREHEFSLLERFDPPKAIECIEAYLAQNPEDKLARLRLSVIGIRLGRPELVCAEESGLPELETLEPAWIPYVVRVLQVSNMGPAALA